MAERMVPVNGVELCAEAFGDPADPAVLLIMGGGSMLWWDARFCEMVASRGRHVIRYDQRDTGRSVTYEPGCPGYTGADLVADAAGLLDAWDIDRAHVVGVSAGAGLAQLLAIDFADRVATLVLISTSPALSVDRELPAPTDAFMQFASTASVDWSEAASVLEYQVGFDRVLAGGQRPFDEAASRRLVRRDIERATDFAAVQNHDLIPDDGPTRPPLSSITAATLVIHGTADPMFPLEHGRALAEIVPNARLLTLAGAGHGVAFADWQAIADAIIEHTEHH